MADIDIERIAKVLGGTLDDPTITKKVEGKPTEKVSVDELAGKADAEASASGGKRPSFMPDLSGTADRTPPKGTSKNSQVDTGTAISAVTILKQELANVGCQLKDYQIKFNLNGIDIQGVKVTTDNLDELRKLVPNVDGDQRHKIASKISSLAMRAIQQPLADRIREELGLDTSAFEYANVDQAGLSMAVQPEEEDTGPEDIAGMMEPELGDMMPPTEPVQEPAPLEMEPAPAEPMPPEGGMGAEPMPGIAPEPMPSGPAPAAPAGGMPPL